jgi:putative component of membrane protein insertase Oxa1/YidC/SpoIIIJ protein YidD
MHALKHISKLIDFLRNRSGRSFDKLRMNSATPLVLSEHSESKENGDLSTRLLRSLHRGERRERYSLGKKLLPFTCTAFILGLRPILGPSVCKYEPSCTKYAAHCLAELPFHKAVWVIIKRVVSCNPFTK